MYGKITLTEMFEMIKSGECDIEKFKAWVSIKQLDAVILVGKVDQDYQNELYNEKYRG